MFRRKPRRAASPRRARPPRATPGPWYGSYFQAWTLHHPEALERHELKPGAFYAGDKWGSSTLDYDGAWFLANGMRMPRRYFFTLPNPNTIHVANVIKPGESATVTIRTEDS